jgi:hypothetical protein
MRARIPHTSTTVVMARRPPTPVIRARMPSTGAIRDSSTDNPTQDSHGMGLTLYSHSRVFAKPPTCWCSLPNPLAGALSFHPCACVLSPPSHVLVLSPPLLLVLSSPPRTAPPRTCWCHPPRTCWCCLPHARASALSLTHVLVHSLPHPRTSPPPFSLPNSHAHEAYSHPQRKHPHVTFRHTPTYSYLHPHPPSTPNYVSLQVLTLTWHRSLYALISASSCACTASIRAYPRHPVASARRRTRTTREGNGRRATV